MPVKRVVRGSDLSERIEIQVSQPFGPVERKALERMLDRDFTFEGLYAKPLEDRAKAVLRAADLPTDPGTMYQIAGRGHATLAPFVKAMGYADDSAQGYAARLLVHLSFLRALIDRGEVAEVARWAFELGALANEAALKLRWGHDAAMGRKKAESLRQARENHNRQKRKKSDECRDLEQSIANKIWARNPYASKSRVAQRVAKTQRDRGIFRSPHTIRQHLKKPDGTH